MAQSDWLEMEIAEGIELEVRFYHCNPRHHTLALAKAPFDLPQTLHHLMVETNHRDDVGAAFDRAWASGLAIPNGLGLHDNDGMFSFYVASPAGFQVEVGHGARIITDDWDDNRRYDRISAWGHQPLRAAMTLAPTSDVAVVGCGPVGLTLSILLAQRGPRGHGARAPARALPAAPGGPLRPRGRRASSSPPASATGCAEISEPADVYEWRNGEGTTLLRLGRTGTGPSGWPLSSMFHQPDARSPARTSAPATSASTSAAASTVTDFSQHQDVVAVAHRRRRRRRRPATSSAATAPTAPCARCSTCR